MKFLFPYLQRLQFRWVAIANALLLLAAQLYQLYLQDQPSDMRIAATIQILKSNNSSMFWYLFAGIGFFLYYRYKERKAEFPGQYMNTFWIPLTVWIIGMAITTAMTLKSLYFLP